ncbi:DNA-binding response regulator [Micromonospora qiuiae]|uniref:DNA-binding response regulator n=1 Tax=Micromonospora qiuiae TaxID=502268 RepID=A0ABQ4J495_9ACTN|nr:response regulator transcription factor [Micromonospora qiuiae]GIJ24988.1 DNA-binding response regulator [Micromonospora qiuiae]
MIEIMIVDDNPIVRMALRGYLASAEDVTVVGEAPDGRSAVTMAQRIRPEVILLDHRMPIADGLSVVGQLAEHSRILVLTSDDTDDLIAGMLRGGARGYLVHGEFDPAELLRAVRALAAGQGWLSPRSASVTIAALREQAAREQQDADRTENARAQRAGFGLTRREQEVMALLSAGHSNAAIARQLLLTEKTVKNHLANIFAKLQATNRTEAVVRWTGRH